MQAPITRMKYRMWFWTFVLATGCAQAGSVREFMDSSPDSPRSANADAATDGGEDADASDATAPMDAGTDSGRPTTSDAGSEAGADASVDTSEDAAPEEDAGASEDAATDVETDATVDAGTDAGPDASTDAGEVSPTHGCVPGTYSGMFEGKLAFFGIPLFDISGEIVIEALTSDTGNELRIENGSIQGADDDGNPVNAEVSGVMDCVSYKLRGGTLSNGTYVRTAFNMTVNFDGVIQATYTPGPSPSVAGTWEADGGNETGKGTFSATLEQAAP